MNLSGPNPLRGRGPDPVQPRNYLLQQNSWRKLLILGSLAANPGEVTNAFSGIEYMQEMTPVICASSGQYVTKQLTDRRDGCSYWVTKLKDGNCWMTQNLDYDDPGGIRVTNTEGANGGPSYSSWENDSNVRQYWDPGEKYVNGTTLANATSSTDRHLLVGNYYSWQSAVAGTGAFSTTGQDYPNNASGSVCPEGWVLPTSATARKGSFGGLTYAQAIGNDTAGSSALRQSPMYFIYGGNVASGAMNGVGSEGRYWSSTADKNISAYIMTFIPNAVNVSNNGWNRQFGSSVRCLVQGS